MHEIAKTPFYTLSVDPIKNRLYSCKFGFWHDMSHRADFIQNIEKAITRLFKGFTILSDLSQLQVMSHEWTELVIETQKKLIEAGCSWEAEISPQTEIAKIQASRIATCSGIRKRGFTRKDEAEIWLDSLNHDNRPSTSAVHHVLLRKSS
jgi:hypothetical protein